MATSAERIHEIIHAKATKPKIALDTCCVQYYINNPPVQPWADCLDPVFRAGLEGTVELYVSTVVVSELLAGAHFASRGKGYDPELAMLAILNRHFQVIDVTGEVARTAGRLVGNYVPAYKMVLRTPDALIGATSLTSGHTLFITNDAQLADALPSDNCMYLKHAALDWLTQHFPDPCIDHSKKVTLSQHGKGLVPGASIINPELGSIRPARSSHWKGILGDAFAGATALNEPCIFLLLVSQNGRRKEAVELLFWHETLEATRPAKRVEERIRQHLGVRYNKERNRYEAASAKSAFVFQFASMQRERLRQSQTCFASKTAFQKESDAWDCYLRPMWRFRSTLNLPQTTWLLCEEGVARCLKPSETLEFLGQAKNVFGWETGR